MGFKFFFFLFVSRSQRRSAKKEAFTDDKTVSITETFDTKINVSAAHLVQNSLFFSITTWSYELFNIGKSCPRYYQYYKFRTFSESAVNLPTKKTFFLTKYFEFIFKLKRHLGEYFKCLTVIVQLLYVANKVFSSFKTYNGKLETYLEPLLIKMSCMFKPSVLTFKTFVSSFSPFSSIFMLSMLLGRSLFQLAFAKRSIINFWENGIF